MTNPLFIAEKQVEELLDKYGNTDPVPDEVRELVEKICVEHTRAQSPASIRLAKITLKAGKSHEDSYDDENQVYRRDETLCAALYTDCPFEAQLIGLALDGRWSETNEAAMLALGIDYSEITEMNYEEQAAWLAKKIDELVVD